MKVLVKDLKPNPYRKIDKYPIDRTKVESLKESINQTGFWDNILSRKENGEYQIAYGHHRLQAIKELGIEEIDIPVKEIDDATMIKIMANENMEDWKINTSVINETVQVAKEYLGKEIGKYVKKKNYKDSKLLSGIFENNVEFELYEKKRDIKAKVINRFLGLVWKHHIIYQSLQTIDGYKDHSIDREAVETFQSPRHSKVFMEEMRRKKIPAEKQKEYAEKIITKSLLEDKKEIEDISSNDIRIEKAIFLMKNTNKSTREIAYQVGFNSLSHFNKMRKKKLLKEDVLAYLENEVGIVKMYEIANHFNVTIPTLRSRIIELQEDGVVILPSKNGIKLVTDATLKEDAEAIVFSIHRLSGYLKYILRFVDLSTSDVAKAVEALDLSEDSLQELTKKLHKLSYVSQGLLIDKQLKNPSLPFDK